MTVVLAIIGAAVLVYLLILGAGHYADWARKQDKKQ